MATYDLEEQEQLSSIKHWWDTYGNLVTWALVALAVAVVGYQGWVWYQRKQATEASALYALVQKAVATRDTKGARDRAGELTEKYPGTAYASLAALLSAQLQAGAGDAKTARMQLAWVAENAKDPELRDLARLRLAAVLLDDKAYDEALKQLAAEPAAAFAARYAELKGDIYAVQGKNAEARTAYDAALAKLAEREKAVPAEAQQIAGLRQVLQVKLDSLGAAN